MRPGGLRRQLRFAARRFRLGLLFVGVYLVGSAVVRLTFSKGLVGDFGPHVLAVEVQKSDQALQIDFCPPTTGSRTTGPAPPGREQLRCCDQVPVGNLHFCRCGRQASAVGCLGRLSTALATIDK